MSALLSHKRAPARPDQAIPATLAAVGTGQTASYLGAALQGTRQDLDYLLAHLRPRIVLWATTRLSGELAGRVEPDDIAQMVLMSVHRDFPRFQGTSRNEFLAWIFTIGENRIRDTVRLHGAKKRTPAGGEGKGEAALPEGGFHVDEGWHRPLTTPSEAAARDEALDGMRAAIGELRPKHQAILRMRDLEMRSYEDICEALELDSVGAARTLRCRALIALRAAMKNGED